MESRQDYLDALQKIEKWENEQKDLWFWEKLGRLPFVFLDKLTPAFLQEKMGQALDEMISYVDTGERYLINRADILVRFQKQTGQDVVAPEQVAQLPLADMRQVAKDIAKSRTKFAMWQGATTGIGGIFTLAVDIPMLLGLSLKVLQEVCLCYGYDPQEKAERLFMIKCLQFSSSDFVGKRAIIEELSQFHEPRERNQVFAQLQGWREVLLLQTETFGWKKLFQIIPVAGILFGAYLNKKMIEELADTANMLYQKRRIMERLGILEA